MNFGNYKNKKTEQLDEASSFNIGSKKKIGRELIGNIQPQKGKKAVTGDGLPLDDSVVLGDGMIALNRGNRIILVDVQSTNIVAEFEKSDLKFLRKL